MTIKKEEKKKERKLSVVPRHPTEDGYPASVGCAADIRGGIL